MQAVADLLQAHGLDTGMVREIFADGDEQVFRIRDGGATAEVRTLGERLLTPKLAAQNLDALQQSRAAARATASREEDSLQLIEVRRRLTSYATILHESAHVFAWHGRDARASLLRGWVGSLRARAAAVELRADAERLLDEAKAMKSSVDDDIRAVRETLKATLPERQMSRADALRTLQLPDTFADEDLKGAYRKFCLAEHPDRGGDKAMFQRGQNAYDTLKRQAQDGVNRGAAAQREKRPRLPATEALVLAEGAAAAPPRSAAAPRSDASASSNGRHAAPPLQRRELPPPPSKRRELPPPPPKRRELPPPPKRRELPPPPKRREVPRPPPASARTALPLPPRTPPRQLDDGAGVFDLATHPLQYAERRGQRP